MNYHYLSKMHFGWKVTTCKGLAKELVFISRSLKNQNICIRTLTNAFFDAIDDLKYVSLPSVMEKMTI